MLDHTAPALRNADRIVVTRQVLAALRAHTAWARPHEACGLIGAVEDRLAMVFCLTNRLASATRYTIDPKEYFGAVRHAERFGADIVGAWHSHPGGSAQLSETDIATSPGGSWITMVVGATGSIGAFRTEGHRATAVELVEADRR